MINALWITLIGMGLVFVAILLLWGLMALMVRLTAEKESAAGATGDGPAPDAEPLAITVNDDGAAEMTDRKRRAAAAAVALALAMQRPERPARQEGASISAWQAVYRASQVSRKLGDQRKKVSR